MKRLALTSLAGCTELMLYLVHVSLFDAWKLVLHEHIPHGSACWVLIFASGTDARHAQSEWNPGTLDRELLHTFLLLGFKAGLVLVGFLDSNQHDSLVAAAPSKIMQVKERS